MKKGRISKQEDLFIRANLDKMSIIQLSKELDRNPDSVMEYVKKRYNYGATKEEAVGYSLETRPFYEDLRDQFTDMELELFKYHWGRIVSQFDSDIMPTEEIQILDVIKFELLMNRCLKSNKDNITAISRIERELNAILTISNPEPDEIDRTVNLERQIGALRSAQESLDKSYRELQAKKSNILRDMKATREQRIKRLEDSRESFPAWIAMLMADPERLRTYGIEMEKMRLAMEKERERLSQYHTYEDGMVDQPLLNSKTVMMGS